MGRITRRDFVGMSAVGGLVGLGFDPTGSARPRKESKGGRAMQFYLTRFSYTPATWAKLIKNPEDRRVAAKEYIESVGGKLHGFWYAFGDHDGYNLWEAPDNVSMAATALALSAGGALSSVQTNVLMTVEETVAAMQKAASIRYRPPGDKDKSTAA